ncbi:hypothetical protein AA106555_0827 [Neokomagataea thailandica NBRC 106555]|uniref:DUF4214 domain-containing protein n=2 Tax=Neokomagataea TaxID=1223423 RepID=A0A4Y6VAY5_9PROT|nr:MULTISPECIES: DUF4214 domain-containing protein [Neokomagataea]QDH26088.1 DUF4214 domain-containing protein [Neokomagataea tanensis]GBR52183.1 hypothetical protein AA106555_0827 [Neokomagataea thailandica NBRC 106555]
MSDQNVLVINQNQNLLFNDNHGAVSIEASASFFLKEKEFIDAQQAGNKEDIYQYISKGNVDYWNVIGNNKQNTFDFKNYSLSTLSESKSTAFSYDQYGNVYAAPDQGGIYGPSSQMGLYNFGPAPSSWISTHDRHMLTRSYADYYRDNVADKIGSEILNRPLTSAEKQDDWNSIYDTVNSRLAANRVLTPYQAAQDQYIATIKNIRNKYIENSPYVNQSAHKMYDNFYGNLSDGDSRWFKDQLKSGKTFEKIWQEEAHSGRMRAQVLDMINGVQDRNDAKEEWDAPYVDAVTNSLANHSQTFKDIRNNLIDGTSQVAAHKMYDNFYGYTSDTDIAWFKDQLHSGKTTQQVWQEEAHSGRMRAHVMDMINGVQDRNDAKEEWDGNYINGFTDRLANRSASFNDMRNELIDGTSRGSAEKMFNSFYGHIEESNWNWYKEQLHSGKTTQQIRAEQAYSEEVQNNINKLYQDELGRSADPSGLATYQKSLADGGSLQAIRSTIAYSQEAQNNLNKLYQDELGRSADPSGLATYQKSLADGGSLQSIRSAIAYSQEAQNNINKLYQDELGRSADPSGLATYQKSLADGGSLQAIQSTIAYSQESHDTIMAQYRTEVGLYNPNDGQIAFYQKILANSGNFSNVKTALAYSSETVQSLQSSLEFMYGRPFTETDIQWRKNVQDDLASGASSHLYVIKELTESSEFHDGANQLFAHWGLPPINDFQLQTLRTGMTNLYQAKAIVNGQTQEQLEAEAAAYKAPAANATFDDYIASPAASVEQATDLMASMLVEPMMDPAETWQDVDGILLQGVTSTMNAAVSQSITKTVIQQDKDNPQTPCDDVQMFRRLHTTDVTNIGQITSANAKWQTVNQRDWPSSYATDGIVWATGAGKGPTAQGLPYEAYVQQKLNGGNTTGNYVWLQDHKSNWMTFDHWNKDTGDAVSDKVLNTGRKSFQEIDKDKKYSPANIKYQIWKDLKEMSIKYVRGNSRQGSPVTIQFTQSEIESYRFELAVRVDGTTDAQWKQICEAYHGAAAKMASYETNGYKPLTFEIDAIV